MFLPRAADAGDAYATWDQYRREQQPKAMANAAATAAALKEQLRAERAEAEEVSDDTDCSDDPYVINRQPGTALPEAHPGWARIQQPPSTDGDFVSERYGRTRWKLTRLAPSVSIGQALPWFENTP